MALCELYVTFLVVDSTRLDVDRFEVTLDGLALMRRFQRRRCGVLRPRVPLQASPVVRGGAVLMVLVVVATYCSSGARLQVAQVLGGCEAAEQGQ